MADPAVDPAPESQANPDPVAQEPVSQEPAPNPAPEPQEPVNLFDTPSEDWRKQMSFGDEKTEKFLERHNDIKSVVKTLMESQDTIRKGMVSTGLPDDPTEEQLAEYREANNIPSEAKDYSLALEDGLVLSEDDQAIMSGVYEFAHSANLSNDHVSGLTNAMLKGRAALAKEMDTQDRLNAQKTNQILQQNWGADYDVNSAQVDAFLNGLPAEVKENLEGARMADGTGVLHSAELLDYLSASQRKINPVAAVVPNSTNGMQTIDAELKQLKERMGSDPNWHKDSAAQERYMNLLEAKKAANR
jgi:hypothetical protein